MTDLASARRRMLVGAGVCALIVGVLAVLVARDNASLQALDTWFGAGPEHLAYTNQWLRQTLLVIQAAFSTLPLGTAAGIVAVALFVRSQRRAAYWTVAVMLASSWSTYGLKVALQRKRPVWDDPITSLTSYSFPSGHSSGIASAMGVAIVLTVMLVRRRSLRRWLISLWVLLVLVVGADRIFLGVHNLSDVVAGWALGAFWVLLGLALYSPEPQSLSATNGEMPEVYRSERRLSVILNPIKVDDPAAFRAAVARQAEQAGWNPAQWYETTVEDPGVSMAEAAAIAGSDMVLVCGGDGTVRTVCSELAGTGIPVGIVPAGTGNLLARNLGHPAVPSCGGRRRTERSGPRDRPGRDQRRRHRAGLALPGDGRDGLRRRDHGGRQRAGFKARVGWVAYVFAALRSLMFPAVRIEVSVDDGPWTRHRARTVVIGNVGYLQAGMPLLPDAAIDDGELDVVILHPRRFLSWIPLALRVLSKGKRTDDTIQRMTGAKIAVRASAETPRQLDGDAIGPGKELIAECVHGKLLVRVPR